MSRRNFLLATLNTTVCLAIAAAQTQHEVIQQSPQEINLGQKLDKQVLLDIDQGHATINTPDAARALIEATLKTKWKDLNPKANDFYCIIHVLRWSDSSAASKPSARSSPGSDVDSASKATQPGTNGQTNPKKPSSAETKPQDQVALDVGDNFVQDVQSQSWYVYHPGSWSQEAFHTNKRLFGAKSIWVLYLHLHLDDSAAATYDPRYEIDITKKTPANLQNLFSLAQLFLATPTGARGERKYIDAWGGREIRLDYRTSDIVITPKVVQTDSKGKEIASPLGDPQTFDNEGKSYWDVSAGVPIRRISQLSFNTTDNTVTTNSVDKQSIFALLDIFVPKYDIKGPTLAKWPHFIGGVSVAKQPLHKLLFGLAYGPQFAEFYAGALLVRQTNPATLKPGNTATPAQLNADLRTGYDPQFSFGINLRVKAIKEALNKK